MSEQTETIDRLFLELSQFSKATTAKELKLQQRVAELDAKRAEAFELLNTHVRPPVSIAVSNGFPFMDLVLKDLDMALKELEQGND